MIVFGYKLNIAFPHMWKLASYLSNSNRFWRRTYICIKVCFIIQSGTKVPYWYHASWRDVSLMLNTHDQTTPTAQTTWTNKKHQNYDHHLIIQCLTVVTWFKEALSSQQQWENGTHSFGTVIRGNGKKEEKAISRST